MKSREMKEKVAREAKWHRSWDQSDYPIRLFEADLSTSALTTESRIWTAVNSIHLHHSQHALKLSLLTDDALASLGEFCHGRIVMTAATPRTLDVD
jgi:hypothetical protein